MFPAQKGPLLLASRMERKYLSPVYRHEILEHQGRSSPKKFQMEKTGFQTKAQVTMASDFLIRTLKHVTMPLKL